MIWQIDADYVLVLMDLQEDYNYAVARVPLHNYSFLSKNNPSDCLLTQ